jgi:hypothetical protein
VRNPWISDSSDAELEALQTDVMRFVAILGLCLAAIFSMVQRASLEQAPPVIYPGNVVRVPAQAPIVKPAVPTESLRASKTPSRETSPPEKPVAGTAETATPVQVTTELAEPLTPTESQVGFSLEFASAADLMALLENGQIQLYAELDGQFWSADRRGRFAIADAPTSYYHMDSSTVPEALIGSLLRSATTTEATWGVVLAPTIVEQMAHFTSTSEGGRLLILRTGRVEMERKRK